jgi:uncharacterized coiled-coil protein SlyX
MKKRIEGLEANFDVNTQAIDDLNNALTETVKVRTLSCASPERALACTQARKHNTHARTHTHTHTHTQPPQAHAVLSFRDAPFAPPSVPLTHLRTRACPQVLHDTLKKELANMVTKDEFAVLVGKHDKLQEQVDEIARDIKERLEKMIQDCVDKVPSQVFG